MKKVTTRRLKKLETAAGISCEVTTIIINATVVGMDLEIIATRKKRISFGKESEDLPTSYFVNEENNEKT